MKYANARIGLHYSKVRNYPAFNQAAIKEMHRQVGDLLVDEQGLAKRGLLVRHLVLPNGLAGTAEIVHFLANEISTNTYLNLMDQYRPAFNARQFPQLNRLPMEKEYQSAVEQAHAAGLYRLDG
jgi:putative pyruvate formate lyase activating enzyme